MSESRSNNDEYIEISITKILVVLFRHKKAFVGILSIGVLASLVCAFLVQPKYSFVQMLAVPSYMDKDSNHNLVSEDMLTNLLNYQKQNNPDNGLLAAVKINAPKDDSSDIYLLSLTTTKNNLTDVTSMYDVLVAKITSSKVVKNTVDKWQAGMQSQVTANQKMINKLTSGDDFRASSLMSMQAESLAKLGSLSPDLTKVGQLTYSKSSSHLKLKIIAGGIFLSLFLALLVVYLQVMLKQVRLEIKKTENN